MKAIVFKEYGPPDLLRFNDIAKPTPKDDEVLVEVHAASVNYIDWQVLRGKSFLLRLLNGLRKPRHNVLGDDVAGRIESVGSKVNQFQPGDEVFGISDFGAFAEYACVKEEYLGLKPANISFEQAAAVPTAGVTAVVGLRDNGQIQSGQKVLINGASGGVGTFAVQIAKSFGAEVTAVCSTRNMDMVRSIGADYVIDYTVEDFTQNGQQYDLILAANGYHPISDYRRALSPDGIYVATGGSMTQSLQATMMGPFISMTGSKTMGGMMVKPNQNDLVFMKELLEAGKVVPVIDRRYPLSEVADAFRYIEEGHAIGKVVVTVAQNGK